MKRFYAGILFFAVFLLTGCGVNKSASDKIEEINNIYIENDITVDGIYGDIIKYIFVNKHYYLITEDDGTYLFWKINYDLNSVNRLDIVMDDQIEIKDFAVGENMVLLLVDDNNYFISVIDEENGNEINRFTIDNVNSDEDAFIKIGNDGNIYYITRYYIEIYKKDAENAERIKLKANSYIEDASIYNRNNESQLVLCIGKINIDNELAPNEYSVNKLTDFQIEYEEGVSISGFIPGQGTLMDSVSDKILIKKEDGIYSIEDGDNEDYIIMNFFNSCIINSEAGNIINTDEKEFTGIITDGDKVIFKVYKEGESINLEDRTIITFACFGLSRYCADIIIDFNRENEDYYIKVRDYGYFEDGMTRFNLDISSGNYPDIVDFNASMPQERYIERGLFVNLDELFEQDDSVSKSDLIDSYVESMTYNGGMYFLSDSFSVNTIAAKDNGILTEYGCSIDEIRRSIESPENNIQIFPFECSREDVFAFMLSEESVKNYVDYANKECQFSSPKFTDAVEFCYEYGKREEQDIWNVDYSEEIINAKNGESLFWPYPDLDNYDLIRYIFGEDVRYVGYPGVGSFFQLSDRVGIVSKSDNIDICWDFAKKLISKEHQYEFSISEGELIPTRKDCYEELCKRLTTGEAYEDSQGNIIMPICGRIEIGNLVIERKPLSKEEITHYTELINNTHICGGLDYELEKIVMQEVEAYFHEDYELNIAIELIENRVKTYLKERE